MLTHANILYVEDDHLLRLTICVLLEGEGWRVEACADGLSALARLEGAAHYDLLLLDSNLPGVSGLELASRARRLPHRRDAPVVILSANCLASEARRAGADVFLRKPEDIGQLVEAIGRLLANGNGV